MAGPAPGEVWLFKEPKFGGYCWKFTTECALFDDVGCNNKASSIRVGPGTTAILFANPKFGGDSFHFNVDASTLGRASDKTSSLRILREAPWSPTPGPGEVYLYRDPNFESFVWRLREPCPDLSKIGAKEKVSSVRLGPNTEAVLYNNNNYAGNVLTVSTSNPNLGNFNDKADSVKIFKNA